MSVTKRDNDFVANAVWFAASGSRDFAGIAFFCEFQNGRSMRPRKFEHVNNHGGVGWACLGYHNDV